MPVTRTTSTRSPSWTPAGAGADELKLHNGTVWRWNRPVYDIANGAAARAAWRTGCCRRPDGGRHGGERAVLLRAAAVLVEAERPLWSYMSFEAAHENFTTAARNGLDGHPVLAGLRLDPARRAGAAQAAADGRRGAGALGGARAGVRPLPAGHRAALA
jgi:hypothetical protein